MKQAEMMMGRLKAQNSARFVLMLFSMSVEVRRIAAKHARSVLRCKCLLQGSAGPTAVLVLSGIPHIVLFQTLLAPRAKDQRVHPAEGEDGGQACRIDGCGWPAIWRGAARGHATAEL